MTYSPKTSLKQTNIPWIGEIPKDWKVVKVKQIVSVKITDGPHETPELLLEGVPFASVESVYDGKINFESIRGFISKEQDKIYSQKCKPQRNDIFIVKSGSTTGKIAIIEEDIDFNIWSPLALVRVQRDSYAYKFIYYFFTSESFQKQIQTFWSFGTQPNIGMGVIENLHISLPSLLVQITIAHFLDAKTERLSTLISNKKKLIDLLREQKGSIIHRAVTKGIDPSVKMKDSGIPWIGEIPVDWMMKKLKYITQINPGKTKIINPDMEVVFLPMEKVESNWTIDQSVRKKTSEVSTGYTYFERNDIIFAKITPCFENGKGALLSNLETDYGFGTTEFHILRVSDNGTDRNFLKYVIQSENFRKVGEAFMEGSAGQKRVTTEFLTNFRTPLPPIDIQGSIVEYIEQSTSQIDFAIAKIEKEITLIEEYRTSLIYQAVTGKIHIS